MSLEKTVLQKLADWRADGGDAAGERRQTLNIPDEGAGWTAAITADQSDALGTRLWELTLRRNHSATSQTALRAWADAAAERVTGLLEPLKVVEVDVQRDQALLRSAEPTRRGDDLFYYEVLLTGSHDASVKRYQSHVQPGTRRQQISYTLTHEALAKLAGDLTVAA